MTALSIVLPDELAKASQEAASRLHLSRAQFIRQAISHELENLQKKLDQEAMAKSLQAMKNSHEYLNEVEEIEYQLNTELPEDGKEWWNKKTS